MSQAKVPGSPGTPPEITLSYGESTNRITTSGYTYDLNGNLTAMAGITGIQWDVFDRMTQATANGSTSSYKYDAFGRRVAQETPNGTNFYFYDMGGRLLVTYPWMNGYQPVRTAYFAGQRVGQYSDRVGSTRYTAPIVTPPFTSSHYYPFGEEITSTANDRYKFAETFRDSDTGLDYAMARYNSSAIGRFLSVDTGPTHSRSPQTWNRYTYAANDPVNNIDPSGLTTYPGDNGCYVDGIEVPCGTLGSYIGGGGSGIGGPGANPLVPGCMWIPGTGEGGQGYWWCPGGGLGQQLPGQGHCNVYGGQPQNVVLTAGQLWGEDPVKALFAQVVGPDRYREGAHLVPGSATSEVTVDPSQGAQLKNAALSLSGNPSNDPFQPNDALIQAYGAYVPERSGRGYLGTIHIRAQFDCGATSPNKTVDWYFNIWAIAIDRGGGPKDAP